jgi:secreted Zn-dependent insulinase-like peptidase
MCSLVPIQDLRSLDLSWQVPFTSFEDREMRALSKPHQALGALINYQGKGSLAAYLTRELGLATSVSFAFSRTSDGEMFSISLGLTPKGLARRDDVIAYVFSYLDLIREQGVPAYVIAEVTQLAELFWNYKGVSPY